MPKNFKGFTLVELMIAISIIALLATMAMISFSSFQSKGRDAKRKTDLASIQGALEQYHADAGFYPGTVTPGTGQISSGSKVYLNKVPSDPRPTESYDYSYVPSSPGCTTTCTKYCLYAGLENPASPSELNGCATKTGYNYAVAQP